MFTSTELADIHFVYGYCGGSSRSAQAEYFRRFPDRRVPNTRTFDRTHRRLREGTLFRSLRGEQPIRDVAIDVEERVLALAHQNPEISTRSIGLRLGISFGTAWRVLNRNGLYPFHKLQVQELLERDKAPRIEFCHFMLERDIEDSAFLANILWTDECIFTREGVFNTHNEHSWAAENPRCVKQTNVQYKFKINVWAGIIGNHLIGPHIFEDSLNGERYVSFLENELPLLLEDIPLNSRRCLVYQHDGAPPHVTLPVRQFLNRKFGHRWIGRFGPILWPARSPDLTPLDFYLWGAMKTIIYAEEIRSREHLKQKIHEAVSIVRDQLAGISIIREQKRRFMYCIREGGGHFEQMLK